jgi:hypothetical protein
VTLRQAAASNAGQSSVSNNFKSLLSELEKISAALKSVGTANSRLMDNLRDNALRYESKCKKAADAAKLGYVCTSGIGCHKLRLVNLTWNEARKSCRKDGARLAILNSEDEATVSCCRPIRSFNKVLRIHSYLT